MEYLLFIICTILNIIFWRIIEISNDIPHYFTVTVIIIITVALWYATYKQK